VAESPSPKKAVETIYRITSEMGVRIHMIHAGSEKSVFSYGKFEGHPVHVIEGPIVPTIIEAAQSYRADMIAMATRGKNGFMDALRGTTTNRVLHEAPCPVLAMPS
jgi:nucleotide-binding universal stress UspA family protein